jgi:threonine dehydrogenase-like Zn-dependent dehydrogenase
MPRTLVLDGPRRLRLSDQPTRGLRPGEIRLRALLSGISHGTELSLYRGTSAFTDKVSTVACGPSWSHRPAAPPPTR